MSNLEALFSKYVQLSCLLRSSVSEKRARHSVLVAQKACELAEKYGAEKEAAWLAGIAHDICREKKEAALLNFAQISQYPVETYEKENPVLAHGKAAVGFLRQYHPLNEAVYFAIAHHTLGHAQADVLLKILFVADAVSEDRNTETGLLLQLKKASLNQQCCLIIECHEKKYGAMHPTTRKMYEHCGGSEQGST